MVGDFADIAYVPAAGDGGIRSMTQMVVIHATDNTASDTAEASYATHRPDGISAHFYSDEDSVTQAVPLSHVAHGCYPIGNSRSVQFELSGLSNRLTDATLRRIAPVVRRVCDRYGLPIRHVGPDALRAGAKGICGHADVTAAWGQGTHTDPGASFPWDTFISYVAKGAADDMPKIISYKGKIWVSDGSTRRWIPDNNAAQKLFAAFPGAAYPPAGQTYDAWTESDITAVFGPDVATLKGVQGPPGPPGVPGKNGVTLGHTHSVGPFTTGTASTTTQ